MLTLNDAKNLSLQREAMTLATLENSLVLKVHLLYPPKRKGQRLWQDLGLQGMQITD